MTHLIKTIVFFYQRHSNMGMSRTILNKLQKRNLLSGSNIKSRNIYLSFNSHVCSKPQSMFRSCQYMPTSRIFTKNHLPICTCSGIRMYSSDSRTGDPELQPGAGSYKDPMKMLSKEMVERVEGDQEEIAVPRETDIAIIGGGAVGLSVAYWLKQRNPEGYNVVVVEQDPMYTQAASTLSVASIRQQFSLEENIRLSLDSAKFFREIKQHLSVLDLDPPDIQFNPQGYLFLSSEEGAEQLKSNYDLQKELGAHTELLNSKQLKDRWPWLNTDGIELGSYGLQNEGWFDPWLLLMSLKIKCLSLGVKYVKGEVVDFSYNETSPQIINIDGETTKRHLLQNAHVKTEDNKIHQLSFSICVLCAGPWAGKVGRLIGLGEGEGVLSIPIPVEPRKRFVYVVNCPDGPGLDMPLVVDPDGLYTRREGLSGNYLCGTSPTEDEEPDHSNLDVDYEYFNEVLWPRLAKRIPAFQSLKKRAKPKLRSAWAGYYDYNYFDQNWIVGNHPYHRNLMLAVGGSGHGLQHCPAIGRAIMEFIVDDEFKSIDLRRFMFDRLMDKEPIFEKNII